MVRCRVVRCKGLWPDGWVGFIGLRKQEIGSGGDEDAMRRAEMGQSLPTSTSKYQMATAILAAAQFPDHSAASSRPCLAVNQKTLIVDVRLRKQLHFPTLVLA